MKNIDSEIFTVRSPIGTTAAFKACKRDNETLADTLQRAIRLLEKDTATQTNKIPNRNNCCPETFAGWSVKQRDIAFGGFVLNKQVDDQKACVFVGSGCWDESLAMEAIGAFYERIDRLGGL